VGLFEHQDQSYRNEVLPPDVTARVAVEMGSPSAGRTTPERKGALSACALLERPRPLKDLQKKFGFTADAVLQAARDLLGK